MQVAKPLRESSNMSENGNNMPPPPPGAEPGISSETFTSVAIQRSTAQAEAKAAKARAKALRPWFKKKRYWLLGFVIISSIGSALSGEETSTSTSSVSNNTVASDTTLAVETPSETAGQENARKKADDYLDVSAFSRSGLIKQLEFEGFSNADATYAVDAITVSWNEQAAKKAKDYLDISAFSKSGLIDQLLFEGFTQAQAEYGVGTTGL